MKYPTLLALVLGTALLSACGGDGDDTPAATTPVATTPAPIVIAHRGASGYLPEHTLGGYELAIKLKADYIEPDLQFTQDGKLVAMHDDTLNRTTNVATLFTQRNGGYKVSDFTLAEIKTLTVVPAGTASATYPGFTPSMAEPYRVPTFDEFLAFAKKNPSVGIYPEAKQADPAMEDAILASLKANGYTAAGSKVFVQSFSDATVRSLKVKQNAQGTKVPLILLGAAVMDNGVAKMGVIGTAGITKLELADVASFANGIGVVINYDAAGYPVTKAFIDQAHAAGLKVHGWTFAIADSTKAPAEYRKYLDMGMDGMFSNYSDLAVQARDAFIAK